MNAQPAGLNPISSALDERAIYSSGKTIPDRGLSDR